MAMTAASLIASSLRVIGVLASGENPPSNEAIDGLTTLNQLIESWSNEQLLIPNKIREVFPLVAGQQSYTMGVGGNFNTARAQRIENAIIQLAATNPVVELPMKILNQDEYASIILKTLVSTFPLYVYCDGSYPLDSLSFWPVPNTTVNNVVLYSWKPLADLTTLTTALSLPPGYERALKYALALELAPEYGKMLSEQGVELAVQSKAAIKRMNVQPDYLQVDKALRAKPAVWNWMTGEPT